MTTDFHDFIICLECRQELKIGDSCVYCVNCGKKYDKVNETYLFVVNHNSHPEVGVPDVFSVRLKNYLKKYKRLYYILIYLLGASNCGLSPRSFLDKYIQPGNLTVNLGSGSQKRYPDVVHVDLFAFPDIDVAADLTQLPFKDAVFDAAISTSVLEHVRDPKAVLDEAYRVLKPGGLCYLTVPFIYPFHSSPCDFYRWTLEGIKTIAESSGFACVEAGMRHGPTSALFLVAAHWLASLMSFGQEKVADALAIVFMATTAPLAHVLDLFFRRSKPALNIAAAYYYVGKKTVV